MSKKKEISIVFHFESSKEDILQKILENQAQWIVKEIKKYPMPQRLILYEALLTKCKQYA